MKRLFPILVFVLTAFASTNLFAQQLDQEHRHGSWCGSEYTADDLQHLEQFVDFYYNRGGQAQYQANGRNLKFVPISYKLVAQSNGSGRRTLNQALNDLCVLNQDMQHADIQFYLRPNPNKNNLIIDMTINNTAWTRGTGGTPTSSPPQYSLMPNLNNDPNAVNVYQVERIRDEPSVLGVAVGSVFHNTGAPNAQSSMILIKQGSGGVDQTMAHEFGHNFSLPHTFFEWEGQGDYVCNTKAGNDKEKYNGSNCTTTGDRFCDTEPDYIAGGFSCQGSNFHTCIQMDADSATGFANGSNIMSYGFGCSNRAFSQDQINAMDFHLTNFRSNLVANTPNINPITSLPTLNPADPTLYDAVSLSWSAVPNATHYAIEINRVASFSPSLMIEMAVVSGTSYTATQLDPSINYHWRVIPFNATEFCSSPSPSGSFTNGISATSTRHIAEVKNVSIQPNFTTAGRSVQLVVNAEKSFEADINIYSVQGQLVQQMTQQAFAVGTSNRTIETANFAPGIYMVAIQTETGIINKKLVVTQ